MNRRKGIIHNMTGHTGLFQPARPERFVLAGKHFGHASMSPVVPVETFATLVVAVREVIPAGNKGDSPLPAAFCDSAIRQTWIAVGSPGDRGQSLLSSSRQQDRIRYG